MNSAQKLPQLILIMLLGLTPVLASVPTGERNHFESMDDLSQYIQINPKQPHLWIHELNGLTTLPALPSLLREFVVAHCDALENLPVLPGTLNTLWVDSCPKIKRLPTLPKTLSVLQISFCRDLRGLPDLPRGLNRLRVECCGGITNLPVLPSSLHHLQYRNCPQITSLLQLPNSLTDFEIAGCPELNSLPSLPFSLRRLDVYNVGLTSLPKLPTNLSFLHVSECSKITNLPELPNSLKFFEISNCIEYVRPPLRTNSLRTLRIFSCPKLANVPSLSSSLTHLTVNGCPKLTILPSLPDTLTELYLEDCPNLTSLPDLPKSLSRISIKNCAGLTNLPQSFSCVPIRRGENCPRIQSPTILSFGNGKDGNQIPKLFPSCYWTRDRISIGSTETPHEYRRVLVFFPGHKVRGTTWGIQSSASPWEIEERLFEVVSALREELHSSERKLKTGLEGKYSCRGDQIMFDLHQAPGNCSFVVHAGPLYYEQQTMQHYYSGTHTGTVKANIISINENGIVRMYDHHSGTRERF